MPTHRECERIHTKKRLKQRYDVELNRHDIREIVWKIQKQDGILLRDQPSNRSVWMVDYKGATYKVVYDRVTKTLATVLPKSNINLDNIYKSNIGDS